MASRAAAASSSPTKGLVIGIVVLMKRSLAERGPDRDANPPGAANRCRARCAPQNRGLVRRGEYRPGDGAPDSLCAAAESPAPDDTPRSGAGSPAITGRAS